MSSARLTDSDGRASNLDKFLLLAWGQNKNGELSLNDQVIRSSVLTQARDHGQSTVCTPHLVRISREPIQVASGSEHSMCVTAQGKLYVSGNSKNNRFCDRDEDTRDIYNYKRFAQIKKDLVRGEQMQKVCCGDFHTLALTAEGKVLAWGGALSDSLGKRKSRLYSEGVKSQALLAKARGISEGLSDAAKVQDIEQNTDLLMPWYQTKISQISCGDFHALALEADTGVLWAWAGFSVKVGQFNKGQCGFMNQKREDGFDRPQRIEFFVNNREKFGRVTRIAAGGSHSLALCEKEPDSRAEAQQTLFAWGAGNFG